MFNKAYMGFDETDDTSPLGIVASMASAPDSFYNNIYCSATADGPYKNPEIGQTGCNLGRTDCRMSASLYNKKMLVKADGGTTNLGLGRTTGFVFNQTLVETYFGKCSFIWDGATNRKYNIGCGNGATEADCDSPNSAFGNVCPSTGKTCTEKDPEVIRGLCKDFGGEVDYPPTHAGHEQCAIPGAAFNYHGQDDWTPATDHLRTMAKTRVKFNGGTDPADGPNIEQWNEIVIDEHLLIPKIEYDPPATVVAILYVATSDAHKQNGQKMRDEYCQVHKLEGKKCIPLVGVDPNKGKTEGPFKPGNGAAAREELV